MDADSWYKIRTYLHFDPPVALNTARSYVTNPKKIATHSFYPFITYNSEMLKLKFDKVTGVFLKKPKERPISYASHLDSHIYAYYCFFLSSLYESVLVEKKLDCAVLAFRSVGGKNNVHFARDAFLEISRRSDCCVLAFDVSKFFDCLDHGILKQSWADLLKLSKLPDDHFAVFKSITKSASVEKNALFEALAVSVHNPKVKGRRLCSPEIFRDVVRKASLIKSNCSSIGVPQGSPISALLSNIYMLQFDEALNSFLAPRDAVFYRYCDDIFIVCDAIDESDVHAFVVSKIKDLKLTLQHKKTEIRHFHTNSAGKLVSDKPVHYLGFSFDGQRVHIRSSSMTRYYKKMRKRVWVSKKAMERCNRLRAERGEVPKEIFLSTIYKGYSYLGRRNFISYGYKAAKIMNSRAISKQLRPHWRKLNKLIADAVAVK